MGPPLYRPGLDLRYVYKPGDQFITMVDKSTAVTNHRSVEEHEHVGTRITRTEAEKLDALVCAGAFLNRADAVRTAIRQMMSGVTVVQERRIHLAQAKKEILAYLDQHDQAYASDIASALELDYDLVLRALRDSGSQGRQSSHDGWGAGRGRGPRRAYRLHLPKGGEPDACTSDSRASGNPPRDQRPASEGGG